ncbi:hypothetical protein JX265_005773 [Neoarthrinium moseri]|uniref:Rhodopsin domain-containing protein n=1 Tax=Neoarthrinium moseri TaxID=1658444 RepID=A0A9Q0APV6_9PEZI|nr:hypothetical protein JX265_005773 [Neoarthrinium moseri]
MLSSLLHPRLAIVSNDTHHADKIETDILPLTAAGVNIVVSNIILVVLTTAWTAMRFWCRKTKGGRYYLEDWMHLGALVAFYGIVISNFMMVFVGGSGHGLDELQPWHIVRLSKATYSVQVLYAISMGLVKISIIWMLMRIFITPTFRLVAIAVMIFSALWIVLTILIGLLICRPIEMNWNPFTPGGSCGDQIAAFASIGIVDILNEVTILALPIPMVWKLRMPMRYKVALACVFGAGILTVTFAAVRLYTVLTIDFTDVSRSAVPTVIYGTIEPGVAIIVACSPALRPIFDRTFGRLLPSHSDTPAYNASGDGVTLETFGAQNRMRSRADGFMKLGLDDKARSVDIHEHRVESQ